MKKQLQMLTIDLYYYLVNKPKGQPIMGSTVPARGKNLLKNFFFKKASMLFSVLQCKSIHPGNNI